MKYLEVLPSLNSVGTLSITYKDFKKAPVIGSLKQFRTGWMTGALKTM